MARLRRAVPDADLLIVDDDSPDGTGKLADSAAASDAQIHVLHRPGKAGLGAAYRAGFRWGLDEGYDVLAQMDADGSHRPEHLPRLLDALRHADLVIGSRWVPGGRVVNWPRSREALSRGANLYARIALGLPARDSTAGFRVWRRATLEGVDLDTVRSQGYCFQIDLTRRAARRGFRIVEVPIEFVDRTEGASKMSAAIVREAAWRVTAWAVQDRAGQIARLRGRVRRG